MIMRNLKSIFGLLLAVAMLATVNGVLVSCDDDDPPAELQLTALTAGSIDLNGATSPTNVPANATFSATFSTELDATTVTSSNITLTRDYDDAVLDIAVSATGSTVTITPAEALGSGTLYILDFGTGLTSTADKTLTSAVSRSFTTEGTFSPAGVLAHWTFEDSPDDVVGDFDPEASGVVAITYAESRNAAAGQAAVFDGDASIIEIPNGDDLMTTDNFTLSFWMKTNSEGHVNENGDPAGYFVLGLGAFYGFQFEVTADFSSCKLAAQYDLGDGTSASEDLWFPGNGEDKDNGGWQGWDFVKDLTGSGGVAGLIQDKWTHVVCVYDAASKKGTMYINGEKMKSQDFNLWPDGDKKKGVVGLKFAGVAPEVVNELAFGFIQSRAGTLWDAEPWGGYEIPTANHYKGMLDDIRVFHSVVTEQEALLMYNSEKP
jgi:hypothetical protein